jgi:hypothetical protein
MTMNFNAFLKIAGAAMLVLTFTGCASISALGSTVVDTAAKAGDTVKGIFTPAEKK